MNKKDYFYFGKIIKPHGYKGFLTVRFDVSNYPDYLEEFEDQLLPHALFVEESDGFHPFFIEAIEAKNKAHFKLKFEDVDDEQTANTFRGKEIYFPKEKEIEDEYVEEKNTWVGYQLFDNSEVKIGEVTEVIDYSGNRLLEVDTGAEKVLVPFNDELIVGVFADEKKIVMSIPEGLIDLNE